MFGRRCLIKPLFLRSIDQAAARQLNEGYRRIAPAAVRLVDSLFMSGSDECLQ